MKTCTNMSHCCCFEIAGSTEKSAKELSQPTGPNFGNSYSGCHAIHNLKIIILDIQILIMRSLFSSVLLSSEYGRTC